MKYLMRVEGVLYTTLNGTPEALEETELTADLFETYGAEAVPEWTLISELADVEVLAWNQDELPILTAAMTATPFPQTIISDTIDLTDSTITGIESMTATCEGNLTTAVSFDNKETWYAWNGEQWAALSEEFAGMDKETLEAITFEQWNELYSGAESLHIKVALQDSTQTVTQIYVDFAN